MKKEVSYSRGSFGRGKSCSSSIRKSRIAKQIAKKQGLKVINLKLSKCPVEDLAGLPFFHFKPTVKEWLAWAKKTKIDSTVQAFVKKHGMKHARLAVHLDILMKGLINA